MKCPEGKKNWKNNSNNPFLITTIWSLLLYRISGKTEVALAVSWRKWSGTEKKISSPRQRETPKKTGQCHGLQQCFGSWFLRGYELFSKFTGQNWTAKLVSRILRRGFLARVRTWDLDIYLRYTKLHELYNYCEGISSDMIEIHWTASRNIGQLEKGWKPAWERTSQSEHDRSSTGVQ